MFLLFITCDLAVFAKTDNDFVNWNYIDFHVPLKQIHPKLFFRESLASRLQNNLQDMDVVLTRSELGIKLNSLVTSSIGYDWFRIFNNTANYENRLWQQLHLQKNNFYARLRLEQRLIQDRDTVVRFRTRFGYIQPITKTLSLDLSDELLFNLNDNSGIDQNRILLSLTKTINENLKLSLGYQLQHFFMDRDLINHALVTRLQIGF